VVSPAWFEAEPRVQPKPPIPAFYLANAGDGGPVNLDHQAPRVNVTYFEILICACDQNAVIANATHDVDKAMATRDEMS